MRAVIIGHTGQDGTLLCDSLLKHGYDVVGVSRSSIYTMHNEKLAMRPLINDAVSINALIKSYQPTEIYYLAAYHTSSEGADDGGFRESFNLAEETHVIGLLNVLCAIREEAPRCKLFYASSSLVFSGEAGDIQDEYTPLSPKGFYAITKAQAMWLCQEFREKHDVFASVGILYNHESHLRPPHFLSQKIIQAAFRAAKGSNEKLVIGDLSARVDWSYASDFVDAFQLILQLEESKLFVIGSGEAHSVQEFVEIVFNFFDLDWRQYVIEDNSILTRKSLVKIGNPAKLASDTGWKRSFDFPDLVKQLIVDSNCK